MLFVESMARRYCCPLKSNRQADDSCGVASYRCVDELRWDGLEQIHGKTTKVRGFPKNHKDDLAQDSLQDTQDACALRWKIEQFHRELEQVTGVGRYQRRKARYRETILLAPCWCGCGSQPSPEKQELPFTQSSKDCCRTTYAGNGVVCLLSWALRKS